MRNEKGREPYMLCCDCGYVFKKSVIFWKSYNGTAICLCRKCARNLAEEINESLKEKENKK